MGGKMGDTTTEEAKRKLAKKLSELVKDKKDEIKSVEKMLARARKRAKQPVHG